LCNLVILRCKELYIAARDLPHNHIFDIVILDKLVAER